VFRRDGVEWIEETKLRPSDGKADDQFGTSVAVSGAVAVVGAELDDDNGADSGSAYVYRHDGESWAEEARLLASNGGSDDRFGRAVAISGEVALVGALKEDSNASNAGAAYVFRFDGQNWPQEAKLLASGGKKNDRFGVSVAIDGDTALVGAHKDDDNGTDSGSAYVFNFDGSEWTQTQRLQPADGSAGQLFGCAVALHGGVAVVGARHDAENGVDSGAAYVFRLTGDTWVEEAKLMPANGFVGDEFGFSVAATGGAIVVGAFLDDANAINSGSATLFVHDGVSWVETETLVPPDDEGEIDDEFGSAVSFSGDTALVGAPYFEGAALDSGAAFVFNLGLETCPADVDGDNDVDVFDLFEVLNAWGPCDDCPEDIIDNGAVDVFDLFEVLNNWGPCA
jgi:hypothetical protein